jgi:hypothetical protein
MARRSYCSASGNDCPSARPPERARFLEKVEVFAAYPAKFAGNRQFLPSSFFRPAGFAGTDFPGSGKIDV